MGAPLNAILHGLFSFRYPGKKKRKNLKRKIWTSDLFFFGIQKMLSFFLVFLTSRLNAPCFVSQRRERRKNEKEFCLGNVDSFRKKKKKTDQEKKKMQSK